MILPGEGVPLADEGAGAVALPAGTKGSFDDPLRPGRWTVPSWDFLTIAAVAVPAMMVATLIVDIIVAPEWIESKVKTLAQISTDPRPRLAERLEGALRRLICAPISTLLMCTWMLTAIHLLVVRRGQTSWRSLGFAWPRTGWRAWWPVALYLVAMLPGSAIAYAVRPRFLEVGYPVIGFTAALILSLVAFAIVTPVVEEAVAQGLLYRRMRSRLPASLALVAAPAVFAAAHLNLYPLSFVLHLASGVLFAWLFERSGSLLPGIIAHGLGNALATLSRTLP